MKNNLITPDRDSNPPDDDRMEDCYDCNGSGEIIEYNDDDEPEGLRCPTCKGEGKIEVEDD